MKTAFTDGACRVSNPGFCSCAFAVYQDDKGIHSSSRYLGPELHSNNWAEFEGLLDLLRWAAVNGVAGLEIFCDSKLVVHTSTGLWTLKEPSLKPLCTLAYAMLVRGNHTLQHIKGHSGNPGNEYVDLLCNQVLDKEGIGK